MSLPHKSLVIISTYNQPVWLEKVLYGYEHQTIKDFEIIIADDGSTINTKRVIDSFNKREKLKIQHIWQEDDGFRKTKILNKAIAVSNCDYLIISDGDCIPRQDFVETHLKLRKAGCFLSGGYFKLSKHISKLIIKEDIETQRCFTKDWLISKGLKKSFKFNKLTSKGYKEWLLNTFTTTKATFDGMNVSAWKKDIIKVNGFDERMHYGGEDRELGERLINFGIKPLQIRYSAICLHLHHSRNYMNDEDLLKNKAIRKQTKTFKKVWTDFGINQ